eukprot:3266554-Prymnesium_polylepis.2
MTETISPPRTWVQHRAALTARVEVAPRLGAACTDDVLGPKSRHDPRGHLTCTFTRSATGNRRVFR